MPRQRRYTPDTPPAPTPFSTEGGLPPISAGGGQLTKPEGKGRKNGVALLPAAARREVYEKFQAHTDKVLNTLLTILESDEASHADRISAGKEILARGWGAVPQYHVVEKSMEHKLTINSAVLRAMTPAQLETFQSMLEQVTDADVVDVEAVERNE